MFDWDGTPQIPPNVDVCLDDRGEKRRRRSSAKLTRDTEPSLSSLSPNECEVLRRSQAPEIFDAKPADEDLEMRVVKWQGTIRKLRRYRHSYPLCTPKGTTVRGPLASAANAGLELEPNRDITYTEHRCADRRCALCARRTASRARGWTYGSGGLRTMHSLRKGLEFVVTPAIAKGGVEQSRNGLWMPLWAASSDL